MESINYIDAMNDFSDDFNGCDDEDGNVYVVSVISSHVLLIHDCLTTSEYNERTYQHQQPQSIS